MPVVVKYSYLLAQWLFAELFRIQIRVNPLPPLRFLKTLRPFFPGAGQADLDHKRTGVEGDHLWCSHERSAPKYHRKSNNGGKNYEFFNK